MSVWLWDEEQERDIKSELIKIGLKEVEQNIAMVADLKTISNNTHASKFYYSTSIFTWTNK